MAQLQQEESWDEREARERRQIASIVIKSIIGFVLLVALMTSVKSVGAGQRGVILQFGKVTGRELQPGLNLKAPWPIQSVWVANVQVQKEQIDAEAASKDMQTVTSVLALNYHLDPGRLAEIYRDLSVDYKNRIIDPAIQESFKAVVSQYTALELLTKRPEVKTAADKQLMDRLNKRGIIVDDLSLVNFDFSREFNSAIEQKQVAQQQAEQAQYNLEKAKLDAQAQESQKVSLTPEILQKMAIEKWNGQMPTYIGSGSVFNIPLTK